MAEEHKDNAEHGSEGGHGGGGHGGGGRGGGGHGGGSHEEHEGAPEWLISFADNVALMMGFFVILLAMNMQKPSMGGVGGEGKYPSEVSPEMEDFAIEMRHQFHNDVSIDSTDPREQSLVRRLKERANEGGQSRPKGPDGKLSPTPTGIRTSNFYHSMGLAFFNDFETALNDEGRQSIAQFAEQLKGQRFMIELRGHASASESNGNADRAMQLSYGRALAVQQQLVKEGLLREQIRVVACSDNERATPRATSLEGHRNNQRVEIVTTQEEMPGDPYKATATAKDEDDRRGGR